MFTVLQIPYLIVLLFAFVNLVHKRPLYTNIILLILFVLTAFRGIDSSADTKAYYELLTRVKEHGLNLASFTPLYMAIARVSVMFDDYLLVFNIINATIFYSLIVFYIWKFKKDQHEYILLFMLLFQVITLGFVMVRQMPAVILFLISIEYYKRGNVKRYFIANIIGIMFHYAAILQFSVPMVNRIYKNYGFIVLMFIMPIVLLISWPLVGLIIKIVPGISYFYRYFGNISLSIPRIMEFTFRISIGVFLFSFFIRVFGDYNEQKNLYIIILVFGLVMSSATIVNKEFSRISLPMMVSLIPFASSLFSTHGDINMTLFGSSFILNKRQVFVFACLGLLVITLYYNNKVLA